MLVIGLGGGMLIWYFFSRYFDRPGPVTQLEIIPAIGPSFPSGSTLAALLCYGLLAYVLVPGIHTRFWKWLVLILSILVIGFVGLSSVIIGSHYATDVIAGYALGLAWAGVIYTLVEKIVGGETALPQGKLTKAPSAPGLRTPGLFGKRPIVALIVFLSGSLTFAALGYNLLNHGPLVQLDNSLHQVLLAKARNAPPAVNEIMLFGFFTGKQVILLIVTILSIYFFHKRYWPELGMLLLSSAAGSVIWNLAISYFARPRPHQQAGLAVTTIPSFPSGHSMSTVICFGFLAYLLVPRMPTLFWKWTVSIAAILIILFNGFSRMFHGGHYLTDVIGGYALGLAWASLVYLIIENISVKRKV
jgi:undecaprenyl-diphosphatase